MTAAEQLVRREVVDGVAVVSLARPDRHNAMNDELIAQWRPALAWAIDDDASRAIVLRGDGPSFCSGRDTSELGDRDGGRSHHDVVAAAQVMPLRLAECPKPVVAALKGHTLGAGLEIALRADFRFCAPDLSAGLPEVGFGLVPDTGGTAALTALVGPARAKWVVVAGERVGAEDALAWGLVHRVVPADQLDDEVLAFARKLAAGPPLAMAFAKQLIDDIGAGADVRRGTRAELLAQLGLFATQDHAEAREARREGRPPRFEGR